MKQRQAQCGQFHGTAISGWFTPGQGSWLCDRVNGMSGVAIALIGIYRGLNLSYIADACRQNNVRIYAVDIWERIGRKLNGDDLPWVAWKRFQWNLRQSRLFFRRWVHRHGLAGHVEIIHTSSVAAARSLADESLDFVFLDADHDYESVRQDLDAWYDKLKSGRLLAGDDWDPGAWPGVVRAVEDFARTRGLRVNVDDKLWSLEKV